MKRSILLGNAALFILLTGSAATAMAQFPDAASATTTTVTSVTGTISQLNYGNNGEVDSLLIGTNVLLTFPSAICAGVSSLGAVGNSVTYSGTAITAASGFESVRVSSYTNNTTKATYTAPAAGSTATAYGPTTGTIKQLNHATNGAIDGFLFTASGSTASIFVSVGGGSTALTTLLTTGATVSVIGTTSAGMAACTTTGALEVVDASSLTVNGQTVVISRGNGGFGGPGGPGGPGGGRH